MYRMQKVDARTTLMHWQIHKDGRADYLATDGRIEVAVALGLDPVTAYSASAPLPKHIDEFMLAGFLKGDPVELVQGKTVGVEVPANAEIVLEGYIEKGELAQEGPFGDHTGFYTPAEPFPVFHVTALTMRRDAIYPSIVVGKPPQEDAWLGKATERIFLPAVKMTVPEIVDYDLPVAGAFHNLCIVSIRKAFPGHALKVMHALWGLGMLSLTKGIVVVDEHVDVHDYAQVMFYVGANVDPKRDVHLTEGPARPPRSRADAAVRGRQDRHRRHRQEPARGCARVAARDRDGRRGAGARRQPLGRVRHRCRQRLPRRRAALLAASATSLTPSLVRRSNRFRRLAPHAPVDGRSEWSRTKEGRTRRDRASGRWGSRSVSRACSSGWSSAGRSRRSAR